MLRLLLLRRIAGASAQTAVSLVSTSSVLLLVRLLVAAAALQLTGFQRTKREKVRSVSATSAYILAFRLLVDPRSGSYFR
jgi:hypothetical protein